MKSRFITIIFFSAFLFLINPIAHSQTTPLYPQEIFAPDSQRQIVRQTPIQCPTGPGLRTLFIFSEGETQRYFQSFIIPGENDSFSEVIIEMTSDSGFIQAWLDRERKKFADEYFSSREDLVSKYPTPCDIIEKKGQET